MTKRRTFLEKYVVVDRYPNMCALVKRTSYLYFIRKSHQNMYSRMFYMYQHWIGHKICLKNITIYCVAMLSLEKAKTKTSWPTSRHPGATQLFTQGTSVGSWCVFDSHPKSCLGEDGGWSNWVTRFGRFQCLREVSENHRKPPYCLNSLLDWDSPALT